jgi:hypothetical protein
MKLYNEDKDEARNDKKTRKRDEVLKVANVSELLPPHTRQHQVDVDATRFTHSH